MVSPIDIFVQLSDTAEGRRIGFQTFLDQFAQRPQQRQLTSFNRPFFSNLQNQAENEFFGQAGQRILAGQSPQSFPGKGGCVIQSPYWLNKKRAGDVKRETPVPICCVGARLARLPMLKPEFRNSVND